MMGSRDKRRRSKNAAFAWRRSARGKGPGCIARQVQLGRRQGPCVCDWCLWRLRVLGG
jgi:hypothetical protein